MIHNPNLAYRPDIDGLRAIAVLSVVLFHFGIGGVSGGFVGVDIFFVISGFLITGIVHREIERGEFTFSGFYERRIRRIFPALLVVLTLTLAIGFWLLLPSDLVYLGKSTLATILFSSNVFFWRNSGYFEQGSELNPLLHTWSLALEEQFYIGFPIFLLLVYRYFPKFLKYYVLALAFLSLVLCIWMQSIRPSATFYLLPFRAWELLIGSFLVVGGLPLISRQWIREILAWVGLALIMASIFFIEAGSDFPGWKALFPVIGAAILIYSGSSGISSVGQILGMRPIVFFGLISYSLYLWHWPALVYIKFLGDLNITKFQAFFGLVLSLILSIFTYYFVEIPFRRKRETFTKNRLIVGTITIGIALISVSLAVTLRNGFSSRVSKEVNAIDRQASAQLKFESTCHKNFDYAVSSPDCRLGYYNQVPSAVLWGDSHALAIAPAFDRAFQQIGIASYLVSYDSCPPLFDLVLVGEYSESCSAQNRKFMVWLDSNPQVKTVILHSYWISTKYYIKTEQGMKSLVGPGELKLHLENTINILRKMGKNIIIVGPIPGTPVYPKQLAIVKWRGGELPLPTTKSQFILDSSEYTNAVSGYAKSSGISIINPSDWLCDSKSCAYIKNGMMIYKDGNHINESGAEYMSPMLTSELAKGVR